MSMHWLPRTVHALHRPEATDDFGEGGRDTMVRDGRAREAGPSPDDSGYPKGVAVCGRTVGDDTSGNVLVGSGSLAVPPITLVGPTPSTRGTAGTRTVSGRLYGGNVTPGNSMTMRDVPIGASGARLPSTDPTATSGYRGDLVHERKLTTP